MKCLGKVDVAAAVRRFIHIEWLFHADLTRGHIDILIRIPIAEDNTTPQLCLAYQNISLRQSI